MEGRNTESIILTKTKGKINKRDLYS